MSFIHGAMFVNCKHIHMGASERHAEQRARQKPAEHTDLGSDGKEQGEGSGGEEGK